MATSANAVLVNFVSTGHRSEFVDFKLRVASNSLLRVNQAGIEDSESFETTQEQRCDEDIDESVKRNNDDSDNEENRERTSPTMWLNEDASSSTSNGSNIEELPIDFRRSDIRKQSYAIDAVAPLVSNTPTSEDISAETTSYFRSKPAFCDNTSNTADDSDNENPADLSITSSSSFGRGQCEATDKVPLHCSPATTSVEKVERHDAMHDGCDHVTDMTSQTAKRLSSLVFQRSTKRRKLVVADDEEEKNDCETHSTSGKSEVCWPSTADDTQLRLQKAIAVDLVNSSSTHHHINKSTCFSITDILRPEFGFARSTSPSDSPSGSPSSFAEDLRSLKTRASDVAQHEVDASSVCNDPSPANGGFRARKHSEHRRHRSPCSEERQLLRDARQLPVMNVVGKEYDMISMFQRQQQPNNMATCHHQRTQQQQQNEIQRQLEHHLRQQQAAIRLHHEQQKHQQHSNMVTATTTALLQQQNTIPIVNPYAAFYAAAIAAAAAAAAVQGGGINVTTETGTKMSTTAVHETSGGLFVRHPVSVGTVLPQPTSSSNSSVMKPTGVLQRGADESRCRLPGALMDHFVTGKGVVNMLSNNNNTNKTNLNNDNDDNLVDVKSKLGVCTDRFDTQDDIKDHRILSRMQNFTGKQAQYRCTTSKRQTSGVDGQSIRNRHPPSHQRQTVTQTPDPSSVQVHHHHHHQQQQQQHHQALSVTCSEISDGCVQSHSSSLSTASSTELSRSEHQSRSEQDSTQTGNRSLAPLPWPAWVYCTRYSDRPSSGPRSRKPKKKDALLSPSSADEKRPRTAFTASQLDRLRDEFDASKYLNEDRRLSLARELDLNESQIKIWFQNKRAKMKKASGVRNQLALQLMAQGLYNHSSSSSSSSSGATIQHQAPVDSAPRLQ